MLFIALIAKAGNYVTPTDQGVYRIINLKYNLAMAEDFTGSKMICDEIGNDESYTQLWKERQRMDLSKCLHRKLYKKRRLILHTSTHHR